MNSYIKSGFSVCLSVSVSLLAHISYAAVPVNTVNDGAIVKGGTYYNSPTGETRFVNTDSGSIWLKTGVNIKGITADNAGNPTNRGGNFHFYAPGSVVRLDGNIDVRGIQNGSGAYLGDGGTVRVDSAYLYQSGNIYANGINGGLVQFNVGSATINPGARIEAKGFGGQGGIIAINASGTVDIGQQAVLDSSGKVAGTIDGNLINIEGGAVQVQGYLAANGVESSGGTIRIVATGQSDLNQTQDALSHGVSNGVFTQVEANGINSQISALKTAHDGDIVLASGNDALSQANLYANGASGGVASGNDPVDNSSRTGDGGTVLLSAANNIENGGWVMASGGSNASGHGGNGGTLSLNAASRINNTGRLVTDGGSGVQGGQAGLIAFGYKDGLHSDGVIRAIGGNGQTISGDGGLVVFASAQNPTGSGIVTTFGGFTGERGGLGTILAADPLTVSNPLIGIWARTQPYEVLTHAENMLFLNRTGANPVATGDSFDSWLAQSRVRSVFDPTGSGSARDALIAKLDTDTSFLKPYYIRNLVLGSTNSAPLTLSNTISGENSKSASFVASLDPLYSMSLNTNGHISSKGPIVLNGKINEDDFSDVGSRISILAQSLETPDSWNIVSNNSTQVAVKGAITGNGGFVTNKSLIVKAGSDIDLGSNSALVTQGQTGGTIQSFAGRYFRILGGTMTTSQLPGNVVIFKAGNSIASDSDPNKITNRIYAKTNDFKYGGYVSLEAPTVNYLAPIDVSGTVQDGQVVIKETL